MSHTRDMLTAGNPSQKSVHVCGQQRYLGHFKNILYSLRFSFLIKCHVLYFIILLFFGSYNVHDLYTICINDAVKFKCPPQISVLKQSLSILLATLAKCQTLMLKKKVTDNSGLSSKQTNKSKNM